MCICQQKNTVPEKCTAQKGSVLIYLVAVIVVAGVLGAGIVSLTTSSTFTQLSHNPSEEARYLAQAGLNYAQQTGEEGTFIIDDERQFVVNNESDDIEVISTVHKDSYREAKFRLSGPGPGPDQVPDVGFDGNLDDYWESIAGTDADYHHGGPADDGAVRFKGEAGLLGLDWYNNPNIDLDLQQVRSDAGGLLSYDLQLKVKVDTKGKKGQFYMMGLNSRLVADPGDGIESGYGLSFFRYTPGTAEREIPDWAKDNLSHLFEDWDLNDGKPRLVLWKNESGSDIITPIDYFDLPGDFLQGGELKDWVTMVLRMEEKYKGDSHETYNQISAFVQQPDNMSKGERDWNYSNYIRVDWERENDYVVNDDSLDSSGVESGQNEIGVHSYYDSEAQNEQFLADFGIAL